MAETVRVHPLVIAEMKAPPNYWDGGASTLSLLRSLAVPRRRWIALPIIAFLVEHPERGPILVDTGFDPIVREDPSANLGRVGARVFSGIEISRTVPEQLRERGIDPASVETIVMTHLHFDHASGMRLFPRAEFVVERRERAALKGGLLKGYVPGHVEGARLREVDLDSAPGAEGFDHVLDLLGDGTLRLAFTPGHTDGHCSVLARTAAGTVLLTGDAAYAKRSIEERWVPLTVSGRVADYRDSLDRLAAWTAANPDAPVICGHDPWDRAALERSY